LAAWFEAAGRGSGGKEADGHLAAAQESDGAGGSVGATGGNGQEALQYLGNGEKSAGGLKDKTGGRDGGDEEAERAGAVYDLAGDGQLGKSSAKINRLAPETLALR